MQGKRAVQRVRASRTRIANDRRAEYVNLSPQRAQTQHRTETVPTCRSLPGAQESGLQILRLLFGIVAVGCFHNIQQPTRQGFSKAN
jgi:hypothetical protein